MKKDCGSWGGCGGKEGVGGFDGEDGMIHGAIKEEGCRKWDGRRRKEKRAGKSLRGVCSPVTLAKRSKIYTKENESNGPPLSECAYLRIEAVSVLL